MLPRKNSITKILILGFFTLPVFLTAQVPLTIQYQSVLNEGDSLLRNQTLDLYFLIVNGSMTEYEEKHENVQTNQFGLLNLKIGEGMAVVGNFADLDWGNNNYELKIRVDKGNGIQELSPNLQFSSVPYSLLSQRSNYADSVSLSLNQLQDVDLNNLNSGDVLKWNGTTWIPEQDLIGTSNPTISSDQTLDGDGSQATPFTIAQQNASSGEVLKWNGSTWIPDSDEVNDGDSDPANELQDLSISGNQLSISNGTSVNLPTPPVYTSGQGIMVDNNFEISNTGDIDASDDITDSSSAGGDINGTFDNMSLAKIQGNSISASTPSTGQVLKWNGTAWVPDQDLTGTTGATVSANQTIDGDGSGTAPLSIAQQNANTGEVLKWNGSTWIPDSDEVNDGDSDPTNELQDLILNGNQLSISNGSSVSLPAPVSYTDGPGILITGNNEIQNTGDIDASDDITNSSISGGDVSGNFDNMSVTKIQGNSVSSTSPTTGQVLKWDGTAWTPDQDLTGTTGTTVSADQTIDGDGSMAAPLSIAQQNANTGEVLKWNGSTWIPDLDKVNDGDSDPLNEIQFLSISGAQLSISNGGAPVTIPVGPTYTDGSGIEITSNNEIRNTGDTNASDDITNTSTAGGDVSGTFGNMNVAKIQGNSVSSSNPTNGEVLKWNGSSWIPDSDEVNDGDSDPSNEIQSLSINGSQLSISNGGAPVTIPVGPTYTDGSGIEITSNNEIRNTGDTNASDDITNTSTAGGDVSGTFGNMNVAKIQGRSVSSSNPTNGEVLKWNGSSWIPDSDEVNDGDSDPFNEIQSLSINGIQLSITNGGAPVTLPVGPTYTDGPGIDITSNNEIRNTGDTNASDDITNSSAAGGDLSGTFGSLTLNRIRGRLISTNAPSLGDVLQWNGGTWAPKSLYWSEGASQSISYSNGNVGIGLVNPQERLEVTGKVFIRNQANNDLLVELRNGLAGEGVIEVRGPNGSRNAVITQPGSSPNHGFIGVNDDQGNTQAQIFVNSSGDGEVTADLVVANTITATGTKNFRIPHPEQADKEIWYACIEGGEVAVYARGTAKLVNGKAHIVFPNHFKLVAEENGMTVILTPLSGSSKGLAVTEKALSGIVVEELFQGQGAYEFDWEVKAIRKGYLNYEVIRDKRLEE